MNELNAVKDDNLKSLVPEKDALHLIHCLITVIILKCFFFHAQSKHGTSCDSRFLGFFYIYGQVDAIPFNLPFTDRLLVLAYFPAL